MGVNEVINCIERVGLHTATAMNVKQRNDLNQEGYDTIVFELDKIKPQIQG